jgi:NAD(P)-dependent dehydrogenase (short-subunit alcohol dehydrogenase family)
MSDASDSYLGDLFGVKGKTALVTGGATGIGRMIATGLVQAGAHVMIASRKGEDCVRVAEEINAVGAAGSVEGFAGDVGTAEGVADLVEAVKARTDRLHILVNNAGVSWGASYEEFPHAAWARVMAVNVAGLFTLTRELTPLMGAMRQAMMIRRG